MAEAKAADQHARVYVREASQAGGGSVMVADQSFLDRAAAILADRTPIYLRMRAEEVSHGFRVIVPGQVEWLPEDDWHQSVVVSQNGNEVRLVALLAKRPGSFRRLLAELAKCGLSPVVIGVVGPIMPAIMGHLNWTCRVVGTGWNAVDEWRPQ